jgi:hypothetical protein
MIKTEGARRYALGARVFPIPQKRFSLQQTQSLTMAGGKERPRVPSSAGASPSLEALIAR